MNGSAFDGLTRRIGGVRTRRQVGRGLLAGLAAAAGLARIDTGDAARTCREEGAVCRKDRDCCTEFCQLPDATGRRRCGVQRCPALDGYDDGDMVCALVGDGFCTASRGGMIYSDCAAGTVCRPQGDSILCDWQG